MLEEVVAKHEVRPSVLVLSALWRLSSPPFRLQVVRRTTGEMFLQIASKSSYVFGGKQDPVESVRYLHRQPVRVHPVCLLNDVHEGFHCVWTEVKVVLHHKHVPSRCGVNLSESVHEVACLPPYSPPRLICMVFVVAFVLTPFLGLHVEADVRIRFERVLEFHKRIVRSLLLRCVVHHHHAHSLSYWISRNLGNLGEYTANSWREIIRLSSRDARENDRHPRAAAATAAADPTCWTLGGGGGGGGG
mmetsp:Transcript_25209/g.47045  ORF Transcript_25209/g.47045 Transcript_25209/m.47045 type:complete len:246 (-) Transcript_25209:7-744(-)